MQGSHDHDGSKPWIAATLDALYLEMDKVNRKLHMVVYILNSTSLVLITLESCFWRGATLDMGIETYVL
jgi:hypothetical protein